MNKQRLSYINDLRFSGAPCGPLGGVTEFGYEYNAPGVPRMRCLGFFVFTYILSGSGSYTDANRNKQRLRAGDVILVFPALGHKYGPDPGSHLDDVYASFAGPIFDSWLEQGVLRTSQPILHLEPVSLWLPRLEAIVLGKRPKTTGERIIQVCRFQSFLADVLDASGYHQWKPEEAWLVIARSWLDKELHVNIDLRFIAEQAGLSYHTFRRRFREEVGLSPSHYRATKRAEAAAQLLQHTDLTHKQIAENTGFGDEYHFSRRFKQIKGMAPKDYRHMYRAHQLEHAPGQGYSGEAGS